MVKAWIYRCQAHGYWSSDRSDFPDLCPECDEVSEIVEERTDPAPVGASMPHCVPKLEMARSGEDRN